MRHNPINQKFQSRQHNQASARLSCALIEAVDEIQGSAAIQKSFDFAACIRFLVSKWSRILLLGLISALAAGILCYFVPPKYEATAKLYILNTGGADIQLSDLQSGSMLMADYREVLKTWEVHENVKSQLGLDMTYREMQELLTVRVPDGSRLLYITVRHPDAIFTANLANAYAQAAHTFIVQSLHGLQPDVFSSAIVPGKTVGLGTFGWMLAAFAAGVLFSAGIYALFFCLDDRIRTPDELRLATGLPVLGSFSQRKQPSMSVEEKDKACLLALRMLAYDARCILVTSNCSGGGTSFVCENVTRALTALYQKALWIRVEHKPFWNVSSEDSLRTYLEGRCAWEDLIRPYEGAALLSICGTEDDLPSLLFHRKMTTLMDKLRNAYDVVLIDAPPANLRADALAFFRYCDGMLLVISDGQSRMEDVSQYLEHFSEIHCSMMAAVLNRASAHPDIKIRRTLKNTLVKEGVQA